MTFTVLRESCTLHTFTILRQNALTFTLPPPYELKTHPFQKADTQRKRSELVRGCGMRVTVSPDPRPEGARAESGLRTGSAVSLPAPRRRDSGARPPRAAPCPTEAPSD